MMSYFILEHHQAYTPPQLQNWHGILDPRTLERKKAANEEIIPKYTRFPIRNPENAVFIDIILTPCLMVSKQVMEVIKLYDSTTGFEQFFLYDSRNKKTHAYYLPKLKPINVLTSNSRFNQDKSRTLYAEVDGNKIQGKGLVQVANVNHTCILIHSDLANSLLRRGIIGLGLKETTTIY